MEILNLSHSCFISWWPKRVSERVIKLRLHFSIACACPVITFLSQSVDDGPQILQLNLAELLRLVVVRAAHLHVKRGRLRLHLLIIEVVRVNDHRLNVHRP